MAIGFQVKRLTVLPGASLSLQMHHRRAEHWIVVSGTARITRDDEVFDLGESEHTYIPLGAKHRIENPGQGHAAHHRGAGRATTWARTTSCASRTATAAKGRTAHEPDHHRAASRPTTCAGRIPDELNEDVAYRIGRAYAEFVKPKNGGRRPGHAALERRARQGPGAGLLDVGRGRATTSGSAAPRTCISPRSPARWTAASWSPPATTRRTRTA